MFCHSHNDSPIIQRLQLSYTNNLTPPSGATIDRLLKPTKDAAKPKGLSATKAGPLLRNSITVRKAGDEHEQAPGFIEADMVVHCGPTLAGEFARTLTATDVFTGWTENVAVRNGAHKWVLGAMDEVVARLPFRKTVSELDGVFRAANEKKLLVGQAAGLSLLSQATGILAIYGLAKKAEAEVSGEELEEAEELEVEEPDEPETGEAELEDEPEDEPGEAIDADAAAAPAKKKTRRGSRGGRNRKKKPAAEGEETPDAPEDEAPEGEAPSPTAPRIHVPGSDLEAKPAKPSRSRAPKPVAAEGEGEAAEQVADVVAEGEEGEAPAPKKKTRRGSRGGRNRKKPATAAAAGENGGEPEGGAVAVEESATDDDGAQGSDNGGDRGGENGGEPPSGDYVPMSEWLDDLDR